MIAETPQPDADMRRYDDKVSPWRREFRRDVNRLILAWCQIRNYFRKWK